MKNIEPIKNQKEANEMYDKLAKETAQVMGISYEQALQRVKAFNLAQDALIKKFGANNPDELMYQIIVDIAMHIPQLEK